MLAIKIGIGMSNSTKKYPLAILGLIVYDIKGTDHFQFFYLR